MTDYLGNEKKKRDFDFSPLRLNKEEFLKKYGYAGKEEQFITVPIEAGRDEAEQLIINNTNQAYALAKTALKNEMSYRRGAGQRADAIFRLAAASMIVSGLAFIMCVLLYFLK